MSEAQHGDTVHIHYTGKLSDGTVFDTSEGREPLKFELGAGQVIPGLDKAMRGMEVGATKTVTIEVDEAYGPHHEEGVHVVERSSLPPEVETQPGTQLQASSPDGNVINLTVVAADDKTVTMDANHPLAGKDLTFDIKLVAVS
ncbi:FKBP-type peptidyl-prolyl cis-trans isomerase [Oricola cellulosilytica]|uniref:Peptidyl-prolyl cis-trans isomerase n=1 Tax=Oricola cellulosilytica TaxID=1429082 RepID=A0A4R0PD32_9HYPH|nr:peptidylprolyl isomerase [Oricola cellulosilytica]TCD13113.1 peptidylprolyl isomerase [Oricola cellulosilytica]